MIDAAVMLSSVSVMAAAAPARSAPVAALVASGVLACVTILPDGRHWYSYGGESAIGAPDARYMAICDLPGALSVARSYRRGEPLYAYK